MGIPTGAEQALPGTGSGTGTGTGTGGTGLSGSGTGSTPSTRPGVPGGTRDMPFMDGMTRPVLLSKVDPQLTREARDANVQGSILAKCVITVAGTLERCRIVKGLPYMDSSVLSALSHWRYSPVMYQGRPTAVEYLVTLKLQS